jgi:hypothetical protein
MHGEIRKSACRKVAVVLSISTVRLNEQEYLLCEIAKLRM